MEENNQIAYFCQYFLKINLKSLFLSEFSLLKKKNSPFRFFKVYLLPSGLWD